MTETVEFVSKSRGTFSSYGTGEMASEGAHNEVKPETSNEYVLNVAFASFSLFTALQFFFALIAKSQAMMADCAAMAVDAMTYLFNYAAERIKNRTSPDKDDHLSPEARQRRKKLQILYLELIPPLISVTTLMAVTILSLKQAIDVLMTDTTDEPSPDVVIMTIFSLLNLILDAVNVSCFAKAADGVVGLRSSFEAITADDTYGEDVELAAVEGNDDGDSTRNGNVSQPTNIDFSTTDMVDDEEPRLSLGSKFNLNMCSAWTHVFADTLRSITTLVAASVAWLFPDIVSAAAADSWGAIFISIIIILSLGPLIQGIFSTASEIRDCSNGHLVEDYAQSTTLPDDPVPPLPVLS